MAQGFMHVGGWVRGCQPIPPLPQMWAGGHLESPPPPHPHTNSLQRAATPNSHPSDHWCWNVGPDPWASPPLQVMGYFGRYKGAHGPPLGCGLLAAGPCCPPRPPPVGGLLGAWTGTWDLNPTHCPNPSSGPAPCARQLVPCGARECGGVGPAGDRGAGAAAPPVGRQVVGVQCGGWAWHGPGEGMAPAVQGLCPYLDRGAPCGSPVGAQCRCLASHLYRRAQPVG